MCYHQQLTFYCTSYEHMYCEMIFSHFRCLTFLAFKISYRYVYGYNITICIFFQRWWIWIWKWKWNWILILWNGIWNGIWIHGTFLQATRAILQIKVSFVTLTHWWQCIVCLLTIWSGNVQAFLHIRAYVCYVFFKRSSFMHHIHYHHITCPVLLKSYPLPSCHLSCPVEMLPLHGHACPCGQQVSRQVPQWHQTSGTHLLTANPPLSMPEVVQEQRGVSICVHTYVYRHM